MVFEEIALNVDNFKLQDWFKKNVPMEKITMRSQGVGGWSIQSSDGSIQDGWQLGFVPYNGPNNKNPQWTDEKREHMPPMQDYCKPTELCTGYMMEVINQVEDLGFHPRRARLILLKSGYEGQWHQDGSKNHYQVRLHIPIFTNENCFFEYEGESEHMPINGKGFLVHINKLHRVINKGSEDRIHLVMNVWDCFEKSNFHRYLNSNIIENTI